ncbi:MAG: serine/threonine protein kinase [Acidobacteria bacterium]|nr:serine/threonine protein kinase [Acidobacteriota bacterium]
MSGPVDPRFAAAREVFDELADLEPAAQRRRLDALREQDHALASSVAALLAADRAAGSFLEDSAPAWIAAAGAEAAAADGAAQAIGPYRTLALLGQGGMGEVYLAERTDGQFEQRVALKVLKRGLDSDEILRRFLRERQILARLEHPNLARLLDGGVAADGRPYFAMEHVAGEPITDWCRAREAGVAERLRLVIACCEAVEVAHRNLIVHRDLKPSNVLVTADGSVKLLDFGIAKLLDEEPDGAGAQHTRTELRLLTPDYAAPEQILGEPVTTATDVFALGLVLHELLTGRLPHERGTRSLAALTERARSEPAERPSTLARRTSPRTARALAGDLDTIVMMALRREPARRYPSAAALGEDLRRHLSGLPVRARPDTLRYRAGKFARRHAVGVIAAGLVAASLVGGSAIAAWQGRRAAIEARRGERVIELLVGIFEAADPERSGGRALTAREIVEQGLARIESDLRDAPDVQADLYAALSRIRTSLGEFEGARELAERSIALHGGPDAGHTGSALTALGSALMGLGRLQDALPVLERAVARLERDEGPRSLAAAQARSAKGNVLYLLGNVHEAEATERLVHAAFRAQLGDDDPRTAEHLRNLGVLLTDLERFAEAEAAHRGALATLEAKLGPDHPQVINSLYSLAVLLGQMGRPDEAEALHRRVLQAREGFLGPNHAELADALHGFALFLIGRGKLDEAEQAALRAEAIFRAIDDDHYQVAKVLGAQATIADRRGRFAESEAKLREVMRRFDAQLGPRHPFVWQTRSNLAVTLSSMGRLAEAEDLFREALAGLEKLEPRQPSYDTFIGERYAELLGWRGAGAAAVERMRGVLAYRVEALGPEHLDTALAHRNLAEALRVAGDAAAARESIEKALAIYRAKAPGSVGEGLTLVGSARIALAAGAVERALRDASDGVARLEPKLPAWDWRLDAARAVKGAALLAAGRAAEGRALVGAARAALAAKLGPGDPRVPALP